MRCTRMGEDSVRCFGKLCVCGGKMGDGSVNVEVACPLPSLPLGGRVEVFTMGVAVDDSGGDGGQ
jgi:hypothetical protein